MAEVSPRKYIVVYRSQEHYEVLGYVMAPNIEEATNRAQKELKKEAKFYEVEEATIGELKDERVVGFNIK